MNKSKILIMKKGITESNIECIVNAANEDLANGGGVCGAIFKAAGNELTLTCKQIGHCNTGEAVITKAFNLLRINILFMLLALYMIRITFSNVEMIYIMLI